MSRNARSRRWKARHPSKGGRDPMAPLEFGYQVVGRHGDHLCLLVPFPAMGRRGRTRTAWLPIWRTREEWASGR